ncbi:electron transfer flavoprotein beta subunit [Dethiosulfatibacter aminovorans DSM 17477]|uniref:Electron transfer flavoprotein small subunit n=1 Tax=Dethiosulfatibacter aminovorans DSM 17477 TaxID=1121476 RepID=A0A1M6MGE4_9FIRM|nr:electron transfer flavoprotein subunit beta/FixA family protein [Dethiosulfatibacter aminovorans]SHJ82527.1 electron transfer flavoprotein beta subunit [Dethiosulfatibacter aminovorans DSM 17477]
MSLEIAVCVKPVPDSEYYDKITIDPKTKRVNREGIPTIINTMDKNAVEAALKLKDRHGGKVTAFTMAPDSAVENIRLVLAMGVDEAILCSDRPLGGADTWATSYTLWKAMEKTGEYDIVILGNETEDGGTAQVPSQLGEWMNVPHVVNVNGLEFDGERMVVDSKTDSGSIKYRVSTPAVFGVTREINEPRIPNVMGILKAKSKPLAIYRADDMDLDPECIGLVGSPTQPGDINAPDMSRKSESITGEPEEIAEKIVSEIKKAGIEIG